MPDAIQVSRSELQAIFRNPRLVRAIEQLISRTQDVLPDQIIVLTIAVEEAALAALSAATDANAAQALALALGSSLSTLESAPANAPHIAAREDQPARLEALEALVAKLSNDIEALKQGAAP